MICGKTAFAGLAALLVLAPQAVAEPDSCNAIQAAVLTVTLPAHPFAALPSADGCIVYVSLVDKGPRKPGAVAVLRRDGGKLSALRGVSLDPTPMGMALSHDGKLLIAASGDGVTFLDTARLISGEGDAILGHIDDGGRAAISVAITPDDRVLFVSDERSASISVVDMQKARSSGFAGTAVVGQIPTGRAPVGLVLSPDGTRLYATSEVVDSSEWPGGCKPEKSGTTGEHHQGAIIIVDVLRAQADPAHAALRRIPSGCNPVRVALSPNGDRLYATARDSNALLVFDTAKLLSGAADSQIASVEVGTSPVGVLVVENGTRIIVTNSSRFSRSGQGQTLSVIDAAKLVSGPGAVLGTVDVGGFPRELCLTADGKTLLVTNFGSSSLSLIAVANMPVKPE